MARQPDNPRNTQQLDEAIIKGLVNIRDQLTQIANRLAASGAREEERMQILRQRRNLALQQANPSPQRRNPFLQQANLDLAQRQRTTALMINQGRRYQNTVAWRSYHARGVDTVLLPFVSLSTGLDIEGFPATIGDIAQINENDARRILAALEVTTDGLNTAEMRDLIRSQVCLAIIVADTEEI
ncbi:hypothetical protein GGI42DRAFT_124061 [Trichoderma sp. SZMC 28013]